MLIPSDNPCCFFFTHRDPRQIEIFCYSDTQKPDGLTNKLQSAVDHWFDVSCLNDERVADKIRSDQIDLLVDTTLHTSGKPTPGLSRGPAPIQLTMLGPPTTTGLPNMHYRLTDPYLDPPNQSDVNIPKPPSVFRIAFGAVRAAMRRRSMVWPPRRMDLSPSAVLINLPR